MLIFGGLLTALKVMDRLIMVKIVWNVEPA